MPDSTLDFTWTDPAWTDTAQSDAAWAADGAVDTQAADRLAFRVIGHVGGSYSLAAVNRSMALALAQAMPGRVRLETVRGATWREWRDVPKAIRPRVLRLGAQRLPFGSTEVAISQHYPLYVPKHRSAVNLACFFWEESRVPGETIATLNAHFDGVLAPSTYVATALRGSGLRVPVHVVGLAPDLAPFKALRRHRPGDGITRFLHVSSGFARKGVDVLLAAYGLAFRRADPVHLTIKTFPNPHNEVAAQLARLRERDRHYPAVELIDADLPAAAMPAIYGRAQVMVLPSRGEGFNLPAAEAMAAGLGVIVSAVGGHADFCTPETARLIRCRLTPSGSHVAGAGSLWAEPDLADLVRALREAVLTPAQALARVARARQAVEEMTPAAMVERVTRAALVALRGRNQISRG